jgi:Amt family ammonium transporter
MEWHPDGLIRVFGHKDFAGGTVVHMSSGYSALMLAYLIGHRGGDKSTHHSPAHIPYVMLGSALLWFGWFGFNGGSAVAASYSAGQALITTNVAAGTAMCTWVLWDYIQGRKAGAIGACGGLVVGLVVITPACGFVTVGGSMIMGMVGSIISNVALHWFKNLSMVDDTLDVWACHGLGGTSGMVLTSLFATDRVYNDGLDGLFYGSGKLFWHTLVVAALCIPYFLIMTYLIYKFVNFFIPFRVSEEEEIEGLDMSYHGEAVGSLNFGHNLNDNTHNRWSSITGGEILKATGALAQTGSPVRMKDESAL